AGRTLETRNVDGGLEQRVGARQRGDELLVDREVVLRAMAAAARATVAREGLVEEDLEPALDALVVRGNGGARNGRWGGERPAELLGKVLLLEEGQVGHGDDTAGGAPAARPGEKVDDARVVQVDVVARENVRVGREDAEASEAVSRFRF